MKTHTSQRLSSILKRRSLAHLSSPKSLTTGITASLVALLSGCAPPSSQNAHDTVGETTAHLITLGDGQDDVNGVQYDISCVNGDSLSSYVPLLTGALPPWLTPAGSGSHEFADLLAVLPATTCDVTATPMQSPGVPSSECQPATQTVSLIAETTTEILLVMQCSAPAAGIDVIGAINHAPVVVELHVSPSKFTETCIPVKITPIVKDPDGDAVSLWLTVSSGPAGASTVLTDMGTGAWKFSSDMPGTYTITIVATDTMGGVSTLSFPIHVSQGDPNNCNPQICCEVQNGYVTMASVDCTSKGGFVVSNAYCEQGPTCCEIPGNPPSLELLTTDQCLEEFGTPGQSGCEVCGKKPSGPTVQTACPSPLQGPVTPDPWNVVRKYDWIDPTLPNPFENTIFTAPIAQITDDNGDGKVDDQDNMDIVFIGAMPNTWWLDLNVIDGATGTLHWTADGVYRSHPAVVDLDHDGRPEIVAYTKDGTVRAFDNSGNVLWDSPFIPNTSIAHSIQVADVEGDGNPELLFDDSLINGQTGAILFHLGALNDHGGRASIGDFDLDGTQEIVLGLSAYNGAWGYVDTMFPTVLGFGDPPASAIVNVDLDPYGEVVRVGGDRFRVHDTDGSMLVDVPVPAERLGELCTADFDGDGVVEVGFFTSTMATTGPEILSVYELDGSLLWSRAFQPGEYHSCTAADLDGNGAAELFTAVYEGFYILDGSTGATLFHDPGILPIDGNGVPAYINSAASTLPTVGDVDGDGSPEVVVGWSNDQGNHLMRLRVYEHANDLWKPVSGPWTSYNWFPEAQGSNGSVPAPETATWLSSNLNQSTQASVPGEDVFATIVDVCFNSCDVNAPAGVAVQVHNGGSSVIAGPVDVTVYANNSGIFTAVATTSVPGPIAPSTTSTTVQLSLTVGDFGSDGLAIRVNDNGSGTGAIVECLENNNTDTWNKSPCP